MTLLVLPCVVLLGEVLSLRILKINACDTSRQRQPAVGVGSLYPSNRIQGPVSSEHRESPTKTTYRTNVGNQCHAD